MISMLRTGKSGAVWFGAVQFAVILALTATAIQPTFRGGNFLRLLLVFLVVVQAIAIVVDYYRSLHGTKEAQSGAGEDEASPVNGTDFLIVAVQLTSMLFLVYLAGMYVGLTVFCFLYWRLSTDLSLFRVLSLSIFFGLLFPLLFSQIMTMALWSGVVPELIPGIIGGSFTPPF